MAKSSKSNYFVPAMIDYDPPGFREWWKCTGVEDDHRRFYAREAWREGVTRLAQKLDRIQTQALENIYTKKYQEEHKNDADWIEDVENEIYDRR